MEISPKNMANKNEHVSIIRVTIAMLVYGDMKHSWDWTWMDQLVIYVNIISFASTSVADRVLIHWGPVTSLPGDTKPLAETVLTYNQ